MKFGGFLGNDECMITSYYSMPNCTSHIVSFVDGLEKGLLVHFTSRCVYCMCALLFYGPY